MRKKQIGKMAMVICENTAISCYETAEEIAEELTAKGYCKASDVAEKIFAEIYKALNNSVKTNLFKGTWFDYSKFITEVDKLEKKYLGGDNNVPT